MLRENHRGGRNRGNERPGRELSASPGRGIPLERNGGRSRRRRRKRSAAPVAAGIVLAVLCLTGAGLGIRSLLNRPDPEALTPGAVVETERFPGDEAVSEGERSGTDTDVSGENGTADSAGEGTDGQAGVHTDQESTGNSTAEERLASMTLEEKAAQLFIITPEALTGYTQVTQSGDENGAGTVSRGRPDLFFRQSPVSGAGEGHDGGSSGICRGTSGPAPVSGH